ncbi:hypothetical protein JB92DRAFT_1158531 [Gautieria morchelliformis]|nr:hypothetical protein JB92DRAFT_1158531 [Gautieria morchelliformis]
MVSPNSSRRAMATRLRPPVLVHLQSFLGCLMGRLSAKPFTDSTPTFTRTNEQDIHYIPDNRHTSAFAMSVAETPWNAHGNEDMHLEILTHRSRGRQRSRGGESPPLVSAKFLPDSPYTRPAQLARSSLSSQIQAGSLQYTDHYKFRYVMRHRALPRAANRKMVGFEDRSKRRVVRFSPLIDRFGLAASGLLRPKLMRPLWRGVPERLN